MHPWLFQKREITFGREYTRLMSDELTMFFIFHSPDSLISRLLELTITHPDFLTLVQLTEMPWDVEVQKNGNLKIFNT